MLKQYKYQIYGIVGIMLVTVVALGSTSERNPDSWINKWVFNMFGLSVSKTTQNGA